METRDKAGKFQMLAERRVNNAIKNLRLVGNLSNKNNYHYTDDDIRKIMNALDGELKDLRSKFAKSKRVKQKFRL